MLLQENDNSVATSSEASPKVDYVDVFSPPVEEEGTPAPVPDLKTDDTECMGCSAHDNAKDAVHKSFVFILQNITTSCVQNVFCGVFAKPDGWHTVLGAPAGSMPPIWQTSTP